MVATNDDCAKGAACKASGFCTAKDGICVVVGIASRKEIAELKSIVRPIGFGSNASGHFHAAVFPYRPLQRGELNLHAAVNGLFTSEPLESILHLLPDDRDINGVGQSEFLRGAIWVGPISE